MMQTLPFNISSNLKKCFLLGSVLIGLSQAQAIAAPGDYEYQSFASGNWGDPLTWAVRPKGTTAQFTQLSSTATSDIPNRLADKITILDQHVVKIAEYVRVDQVYISPGAVLEIKSGKVLEVFDAAGIDGIIVNGTAGKPGIIRNVGGTITLTSAASKVEFKANSKYEQAYDNAFGYIPQAIWDANATIEFNMTGTPGGLGTFADFVARGYTQEFGNVVWNTPGNTVTQDLKGAFTKIKGNFEVLATGTGNAGSSASALVLSSDGNYALNIGKNLLVSGNKSDLVFSSSGAPSGGALSMAIGEGMQIVNGGGFRNNKNATPLNISFTGTGVLKNTSSVHLFNVNYNVTQLAVIALGSELTVPGTAGTGSAASVFTVNGTLVTGNYSLEGNGNFTLSDYANLYIGSPEGITTTGFTGNIQSGGIVSLSQLATYVYNGNAQQFTGNRLPSEVSGLTIDNAAGLTLSKSVTVNHATAPATLRLTNGVITTAGSSLTVGVNGSLIMPSPDKTSYINGPISQVLAGTSYTTLNFPVGKAGNYRPISLSLTQTNPVPTTYTAEQFEGNQAISSFTIPASGSIDKVSSVRYFSIQQSPNNPLVNGGNYNMITLSYGPNDQVTDPNELYIAKSEGTEWVGLFSEYSSSTSTTSMENFTSLGYFALANSKFGNNPLPVELLTFSAKSVENDIVLAWETASEQNSSHFEIERSHNARTFETIGSVKAQGSSQTLKRYAFEDKNPLSGVAYYRLKQVDTNGTVAYSKIETISRTSNEFTISLYPNPVASHLTVDATKGLTKIRIVNMLGQEVISKIRDLNTTEKLELNQLPNGIYQIEVEAGNTNLVRKFVKAAY